jgi:AraC-like DNA-binding protein
MVLAYAGLIFFVILRKRLTEKQGSPDRKPLELKSYRDEDLARIKHHLEEHYTDEEISTRSIYKTLGIPASRVFRLLREEYGLSFKQLLNKMRIEESRRLLRETDVRIIDIALRLGFNDISYFNKLFKKSEGETPSDFRQRFDS